MSSRMLSKRMRRLAAVAVAAVVAITVSSCVTIPTGGPVLTGREVSEQESDAGSVFTPEGPIAGADQEVILSGFLAAHSGSGNYDVARQFLSAALADEWDPRESILIRSGGTDFERLGETAIAYDISVAAIVDRDGLYTPYPLAPQTLAFQFVQEDGEWRISAAPNGIVLSARTFTELFSPYPLYFLDPARETLVPDLRWFPGGAAATRIVTALLNGPPAWLEGAVGTAFPEGTQLSSPRRVAESEVAVVNLTDEALAATGSQRQLMRSQLVASLSAIDSIDSVELSVGGTPLTMAPMEQSAPQFRPQVDSRMLVLRDGEFGYLAGDRITPVGGLSDKVVATNPSDVTLGANGTVAATLGDGGAFLVQAEAEEPLLVDARSGLIAPTLDGFGYVWTVQGADPGSILVSDPEGNQVPVPTTLPQDAAIVSLEVSRDGARIAALLATSAGTRLIVSSIIRDPDQGFVPIALGSEPRVDLIVDGGTAIDATWVDELRVGVLSNVDGQAEVVSIQVGGERKELGSPGPSVAAIVGGNNESGLRVLGADGVVSSRRGSGWQPGATVSVLATQR